MECRNYLYGHVRVAEWGGWVRRPPVVVSVNKFTVGSFFNYTDKLHMRLKSSLVYKFSCAQCASEYVVCPQWLGGIRIQPTFANVRVARGD